MTVHAVHNNSGSVVGMGGGSPGYNRRLDFMAGRAELWCGCPDHGVIADAEQGERNDDAYGNQYCRDDILLHSNTSANDH